MKIKTEEALFEVPAGSRLYGTNGPSSDLDFKVVCLPAMSTLLLNYKVTNRKVTPEGKKDGEKMLAGEAEYEYIPLQIFFDDFLNGQTYALEIAFAVLQDRYTCPWHDGTAVNVKAWMTELVDRFLTKNVQKMVGYAVSQARLYGLKTERYTSLKAVTNSIFLYFDVEDIYHENPKRMKDTRVDGTLDLIETLLEIPHVKYCEIENAQGGSALAPALDICGKKFPYTAKWDTVVKSLDSSIAQYGERVKKYDGQGIDWKALSHAIRITEQVIELSTTGKITFPHPNAAYLKDVKEGKLTIDEATDYLTEKFNTIDEVVAKSVLKDRTSELEAAFEEFKFDVLSKYYGL